MNRPRAVKLMEEYLGLIGVPPCPETDETARRIVDMHLNEFTSIEKEPDFKITTFKPKGMIGMGDDASFADQLIIAKDIEFRSFCAHHLLPYFGVMHVGYLPNEKIVGLSKIPRLVEFFSSKPTSQEALVHEIGAFLLSSVEARAVFVSAEAMHTCVTSRGIKSRHMKMVTNKVFGELGLHKMLKDEFFAQIGSGK